MACRPSGCFLGDGDGGTTETVLVHCDRATKMVGAHHVPAKGACQDWVVQQVCRDIEKLGYWDEMTIKTDQEVALVDLMKEVAMRRGNRRTLLEHSPVGESQANGLVERCVRSVEEMCRVLILDLSRRVNSPISVKDPVFPWIVEHAADLLNKCQIAADGCTAFERLKLKKHRGEMHPFGSTIMFRVAGKPRGE